MASISQEERGCLWNYFQSSEKITEKTLVVEQLSSLRQRD